MHSIAHTSANTNSQNRTNLPQKEVNIQELSNNIHIERNVIISRSNDQKDIVHLGLWFTSKLLRKRVKLMSLLIKVSR